MELVKSGRLDRPRVQTRPLAEVNEALADLRTGRDTGGRALLLAQGLDVELDRVEPLIDAVDIDLGLNRRAASRFEDKGAFDHVELGQGNERHDPERHHADE